MDTPDRNQKQKQTQNQIGTPLTKSKFEGSPVFNFINSLSPIKPVKSAPITQTFTSLNFSSLPSIFASPQLSSQKESRFLRRHQSSDLSKSGFTTGNGTKACKNEGNAAELYDNLAEPQDSTDLGVCHGEASIDVPSEHSQLTIEPPQPLKYDLGSPTSHCGTNTDLLVMTGTSMSIVPFVPEASQNSLEGNMHLQEMHQREKESEWENLICDTEDLLIFNSPNDSQAFRGIIQKSLDSGASFCASLFSQNEISGVQETKFVDHGNLGHKHQAVNDYQSHEDMGDQKNNKTITCFHRGVRRRCLDFEMVGITRDSNNGSNATVLPQSDDGTPNDKQLVPLKLGTNAPRCVLPAIGLHLNALAAASKECKKNEASCSGMQRLKLSGTTSSLNSVACQEPPLKSSESASSQRGIAESEVRMTEDSTQASFCLVNEELNQTSPKKKRRKMEHASESEGCKRCNCKKSKCLKLYCECFAAGVYCIEPCSCQDCFNKPIHEDTVLATRKQIESRNPLAFAPKVIRSSDFASETGDESNKTPSSARHKRGCNCKKSSCLKKYCECYQGGVGCSLSCRCEGCKNVFGRKDGPILIGTEAEPEGETETCDKSVIDNSSQKTEAEANEDRNPSSVVPSTPLQLRRPLVQLPFSSKSKQPRSSSFLIGSSSGLYVSQKLGKSNLQPQPKFEKPLQTVPEDELPEILRDNCSPSSGVKTASPNSKRVSPPNSDSGSSPVRRSGRKLILQSIPSFPSLTPHH